MGWRWKYWGVRILRVSSGSRRSGFRKKKRGILS
jgi:hypothetical protein